MECESCAVRVWGWDIPPVRRSTWQADHEGTRRPMPARLIRYRTALCARQPRLLTAVRDELRARRAKNSSNVVCVVLIHRDRDEASTGWNALPQVNQVVRARLSPGRQLPGIAKPWFFTWRSTGMATYSPLAVCTRRGHRIGGVKVC